MRFRLASLLAVPSLFAAIAVGLPACGGSDDEAPASVCHGVKRADGKCYAKCDPTSCADGAECVTTDIAREGECMTTCTKSSECLVGAECSLQTRQDSGETGMFCTPRVYVSDDAGQPKPAGAPGDACAKGADCDDGHGIRCVDGACAAVAPCGGLKDCAAGAGTACVNRDGFTGCFPAKEHGKGQYGSVCPNGAAECDAGAGFVCVGAAGDIDAYCAKAGKDVCKTDADCSPGFWCGETTPVDDKNNKLWDQTVAICLRRSFCAPCATDLDCSQQTGAVCVPDAGGEKFCSLPCDPTKPSCRRGAECVDTGGGAFACRPFAGSCHPKAAATGCDACRIDKDCGPGAVCRGSKEGFQPTVTTCAVPCGPKDANGKASCPAAPNGFEMVCLDENTYDSGFFSGPYSAADGNALHGLCYPPFTVKNTAEFPDKVPPRDVCGNAIREGKEECDDSNGSLGDGCDTECRVIDECRFRVEEPNGDDARKIVGSNGPIDHVPPECDTFLLEGAIDAPGDLDAVDFDIDGGQYDVVTVFTDAVGSCTADLVAEVRTGTIDMARTCKDLHGPMECSPTTSACGSCSNDGQCGACDDDGGLGLCPRFMVTHSAGPAQKGNKIVLQTTKYSGPEQRLRVYAKSPSATVSKYVVVVERLQSQSAYGLKFGTKNELTLSCF
ncbi:MAG: hypothetical protein IT374_01920 [Polyangiaceae bacterium]|nr:hypothetical protein [Polyangiaceae bacterium]